jgi:molybdenum cofactor cytidylyltransferase
VCDGYRRHPEASVVVPVADGRRGHPVLLAWHLAAEVFHLPPGGGVDALVRSRSADTVELPAAVGVLSDLDTPADLAAAGRPTGERLVGLLRPLVAARPLG